VLIATAVVVPVVLVASLVSSVLILLFRPLPTTDADTRLLGLDERAEIVRDSWGVPHIFARTTHDLFYLQGYAVAQDRLFQLELLRRAGRGQLAVVLGPAGAESDTAASGLASAAEAEEARLGASARAAAQAYADGVNKFLEQHGESLPLEFTLLGFRPAPWSVGDTLVVQRLLARERGAGSALGRAIAGGGTDAGASCRATVGLRSASGRPFLEGDPRLAGEADPSLWYAVALTGPDDEVAGLSAPGVPGIAMGHNRRIAWSFVAGADASLLRDLDASLAVARAGDAASFAAALRSARSATPAYCYADAAGHIGVATGAAAAFDPPGGEIRQGAAPSALAAAPGPIVFRHPLAAVLPPALRSPLAGLLTAGPYDPPAGGALERIKVDLGDLDATRAVLPLGDSGQPAGRHHGDQTASWRAGLLLPLPLSRARLGTGEATLVLRPR
jgi:acyl-homoserine lactone acylase PvdQ